jgi:hypothetical protein
MYIKINNCKNCNGRGLLPWGRECNCGDGEGCGEHDEFWMKKCPVCKGKHIWDIIKQNIWVR